MKKTALGLYTGFAILAVLFIIVLATGYWKRFFYPEEPEETKARVITVQEANSISSEELTGQIAWEDNLDIKMPLQEGEMVIAVLNKVSEEGFSEEQFVVYRTSEAGSPVYITFFSYDERTRDYRRMWDEPTAATRPETITLFSQDLIGDRNNCIIVTGMNSSNEHTITVFRLYQNQNYRKIAELQIDGSILIQETARSLAYQQGITTGQSYNIAAYSYDSLSANILDQIETIYSYNASAGRYEQTRLTRIPGSQVEQRRIRELLSGTPGVFEQFINDLWYYISPQGTIDTRQFLYFDPIGREIIFYGDEAQQVFEWQSSAATRYGLYIRSRNISINTLLRFIDIELETLDSIRLRVNEDVKLRITANTTWDGTYRRASTGNTQNSVSRLNPYIDAVFDSSWGRIQFSLSGHYSINSASSVRNGRYLFYSVNDYELLELRPEGAASDVRMVYSTEYVAGVVILSRVRLGTTGVFDLLEPPVTLTPVNTE